jgi:hypothetical protein
MLPLPEEQTDDVWETSNSKAVLEVGGSIKQKSAVTFQASSITATWASQRAMSTGPKLKNVGVQLPPNPKKIDPKCKNSPLPPWLAYKILGVPDVVTLNVEC